MKYYAVKKGRHPGIYNTWEECQNEVNQFKNAQFKSFTSNPFSLAPSAIKLAIASVLPEPDQKIIFNFFIYITS